MSTHPTVLLIEDDRFLSAMYAEKLSLNGFRVVVAMDGPEGVSQAMAHHPDIILLDILLPKLDGFSVLKKMRAQPVLKDVPVIVLTNLSQPEQITKAYELGAIDYLVKAHFVPSEVVEKIREHLPGVSSQSHT